MGRVIHQLMKVPKIDLFRHVQGKIGEKKKFNLQRIDLLAGDPSYFGIVEVVEILVVEKFGCEHDGCYEDSVDIQSC